MLLTIDIFLLFSSKDFIYLSLFCVFFLIVSRFVFLVYLRVLFAIVVKYIMTLWKKFFTSCSMQSFFFVILLIDNLGSLHYCCSCIFLSVLLTFCTLFFFIILYAFFLPTISIEYLNMCSFHLFYIYMFYGRILQWMSNNFDDDVDSINRFFCVFYYF